MNLKELLNQINNSMDNVDLVSARKYIEQNIELVEANKHHLKSNARALFDIFKNNTDMSEKSLNRLEMNIIYSINKYATEFDLRGLKTSIKNNADLLMKEEVKYHLNSDAKTLLISMNVISKEPIQV